MTESIEIIKMEYEHRIKKLNDKVQELTYEMEQKETRLRNINEILNSVDELYCDKIGDLTISWDEAYYTDEGWANKINDLSYDWKNKDNH